MAKKSLYVVIVGCGRLGSYLANRLSALGHSVVVVDKRPETFANLSVEFSGFKVLGDAAEWEVLKEARLERADCLIAAAQEDNVNLMAAQVAATVFKVPRVMARVADPAREQAYHHLSIETVSPAALAGDLFVARLEQAREGGRA